MKSEINDVEKLELLNQWAEKNCNLVRRHPQDCNIVITANNYQRSIWNNRVFNRMYPKDDWYMIGHIIMYDQTSIKKRIQMGRFQEFYLVELSQNHVVLKNRFTGVETTIEDDDAPKWINDHFTYPFGFTCHAWQGSTISQKNLIVGFYDRWISNEWRFTALTRNDDFKDIHLLQEINKEKEFIDNIARHKETIQRHLESDIQRFGIDNINIERYITPEWLMMKLHDIRVNQRVCRGCGGSPTSIDRIQSHLPHYKSNCQIICYPCNRAKKDFV